MEVADLTPPDGQATAPAIVIAEDNAHDVQLLLAAFRERRFPVRFQVASTATQLYAMLRSWPPSAPPRLIILDLSLPISSGHDILRSLTADPRWRRVPKVVFSSSERTVDRAASFAAGAVEHLIKPMHFEGFLEIADRIQAYLQTERV